ncbi:MAG: class I SAM-dependent methyltransferase [Desulfobacteraceae bacterium]|nr:class I SAM-dependent methyltransferase [Desulfobacteraceae bacterium]
MNTHICPASHAGFLSTSLRRLIQKPERILAGLVTPGQTVADIGCGPGFFTLSMVKLVGKRGTVIAADLQPAMLERLKVRAVKQDSHNTIRYHLCAADSVGITEKTDFILAFYMVHEVPDPGAFFRETRGIMKPGGRMLYVEPKFHVTRRRFQTMVGHAEAAGWRIDGSPKISVSRAVLLY